MDRIETYFANKGVKVIVNGLGFTPELRHSFVSDYRDVVDRSKRKKSQFVKISTYSDMYTFEPRPKFTGFEKYKEKDLKFRKEVFNKVFEMQYSSSLQVNNKDLDKTKSYKTLLSNSLEQLENPLLYLSGGLDSELVANAFLEKNIEFKTVIFEYVDENNNITNLHDVSYAYKYCKRHGIIPDIIQINIDQLWSSEYFKKLAMDLQYTSPHIATYAHMVELTRFKYPNSTHIFGGEIRFFTDYPADNGDIANIILLNKVVPSYNGQSYTNTLGCGQNAALQMRYFNNGTWDILSYQFGIGPQTVIASGSWYQFLPTRSYMIRISSISNESFQGTVSPATAPSDFVNIGNPTQVILCISNGAGFGDAAVAGAMFTTELREVGQTIPGVFATVEMYAISLCF